MSQSADLDANVEPTRRPLEYLFVVTYGRSGSTLVQGLLNTMPGALIRGENNFYILPMYESWRALAKCQRSQQGKTGGPRWAFYGIDAVQLDDFASSVRQLVVRQLTGSAPRKRLRTVGFKEIRWYQIEPKETARFFEFFEEVFPGARYLLNRRDHEQVASSGFWQKREADDIMAALRRVEEIQDFLHATRPDRTHHVRYERLTNPESSVVEAELRSLAGFVLGETYDGALITRMHRTMTKGHGPRPFGKSRPDQLSTSAEDEDESSAETPT